MDFDRGVDRAAQDRSLRPANRGLPSRRIRSYSRRSFKDAARPGRARHELAGAGRRPDARSGEAPTGGRRGPRRSRSARALPPSITSSSPGRGGGGRTGGRASDRSGRRRPAGSGPAVGPGARARVSTRVVRPSARWQLVKRRTLIPRVADLDQAASASRRNRSPCRRLLPGPSPAIPASRPPSRARARRRNERRRQGRAPHSMRLGGRRARARAPSTSCMVRLLRAVDRQQIVAEDHGGGGRHDRRVHQPRRTRPRRGGASASRATDPRAGRSIGQRRRGSAGGIRPAGRSSSSNRRTDLLAEAAAPPARPRATGRGPSDSALDQDRHDRPGDITRHPGPTGEFQGRGHGRVLSLRLEEASRRIASGFGKMVCLDKLGRVIRPAKVIGQRPGKLERP